MRAGDHASCPASTSGSDLPLAAFQASINGRFWVSTEERAEAAAAAGGPTFDRGRWCTEDDELVVSNGQTYAFSKMWGIKTEGAIEALLRAYPDRGVSVKRSDAEVERP